MSTSSKIRLGFVGTGSMGQMAHLKNYATMDDCEIVAVCDLRKKTAQQVASHYGIPHCYTSHREMLQAHKFDAIVAAMHFTLHGSLLSELIPHTRFLFTEKPLALSVQTAERLSQLAQNAGCTHMVGYHKRSDPAMMYAKTILDRWKSTGEMGKLTYVRITMPPGDWISNGRIGLINLNDTPVGQGPAAEPPLPDIAPQTAPMFQEFVNYYIHQVNMMRHLLGEPYKVRYADKSGVLLAVESQTSVPGVIEMSPYQTTTDWQENALVAFEHGYIKISWPAPMTINRAGTVEIYEDPKGTASPKRISPTLPWIHAMRQQAMNFIKVCKGEMRPPCDAVEAVEDLKIARDYILMRYPQ